MICSHEYDVKPWQNLHRWQRLQTINASYIQSLQSKDLHIPPDRLQHTKHLTEIIDLIYYRTELESRGEVGSSTKMTYSHSDPAIARV